MERMNEMKLSALLKQLLQKGYKAKHFAMKCKNCKMYMIEPSIEFENEEIIIQAPPTNVLLKDTENFYENILSNSAKIRLNQSNIIIELSKEA